MKLEQLSDTITKITCSDGKEIYLVGTAHVSQQSVDEVISVIEEIEPDRICVELDEGRFASRTQKQSWENLNLTSVIKENKGFLLLANMALSSYQRRLGDQLGVLPGDEIMKAAELAQEKGIALSLCDREIQTTFKRAWGLSSLYNKAKLISALLASVFSSEEITVEELERLKETDVLQTLLEEMAEELPTIKRVLIDERDQYLATNIYEAQGSRIVAVVGAGHVPGLVEHMRKLDAQEVDADTAALTYLPPPSKVGKIVSWTVVILLVALIASGFFFSGWDQGIKMFLYWFILNSSLTGLAALLSLAHPITIIISMLAAPVTALSPTLGVGMVAALVEASVRKPRVRDFEGINDDIARFKGWFSNRIIHALMLFMTTSIFASIGTFIAFPVLVRTLASGG
ncbi:MAG: TraB/GumN family protein [Sphaerochaetaceae bacterium]